MENICPCCDRHCPKDDLHCRRGEEHFGVESGGSRRYDGNPGKPEERMIVLLRKCGHFLHHNVGRDGDAAALADALTAEEKATLETLLEKCLAKWQEQ